MKINAEQVKKLRTERHWSQEQLAAACGVNLRTIQRLENTGKGVDGIGCEPRPRCSKWTPTV